ncbi:MAG: motility associated factor glycosyltransferase family protein [Treponema bryantii]|nr:motility associated factor glycosyltransferase family protein [Treponema bryantii]
MNSIWNNNLKLFNSRFPDLFNILEETFQITSFNLETQLPSLLIQTAKNGEVTASDNGKLLHSAYNPSREAHNSVFIPEVQEKSSIVFYGMGIGYHLVEAAKLILQNSNKKKLIVVEPNLEYFLASLQLIDWTEIFKVEKLVLAINCPAESVLPLIEDTTTINTTLQGVSDAFYFDIASFTQHNQQYFECVKTIISRNKHKNEINAATTKKFGKLWSNNCKKNAKYINQLEFINIYKNKFIDIPFVIVAAGPTLQKNLINLKKIYESKKSKNKEVIIVCVETALKILLKNKINPDFIILTDPQFWAYRHIAGAQAPESVLITELSTYPSVFRFNCKKIVLCASQFPNGKEIEQKAGFSTEQIGDLGSGGSVASCCWNFAVFAGAKQIYLMGLDLSFPGGQTHIKGSSAEQTWHTKSNRLANSDKFTTELLHNANVSLGTNYNNAPVLTDSRMKMFAWWFESRLASLPQIKTYTFSKEGLKIPGIEYIDFEKSNL